jgi:hypothetical protein
VSFAYLPMKMVTYYVNYGKCIKHRLSKLFTINNNYIYRCKHHFHKACLHEWVALNYRCPMCKQDSRGKDIMIDV